MSDHVLFLSQGILCNRSSASNMYLALPGEEGSITGISFLQYDVSGVFCAVVISYAGSNNSYKVKKAKKTKTTTVQSSINKSLENIHCIWADTDCRFLWHRNSFVCLYNCVIYYIYAQHISHDSFTNMFGIVSTVPVCSTKPWIKVRNPSLCENGAPFTRVFINVCMTEVSLLLCSTDILVLAVVKIPNAAETVHEIIYFCINWAW